MTEMHPPSGIMTFDELIDQRAKKAADMTENAIEELAEAIRLTREYVGPDLLPAAPGWSWYDALQKHAPHHLPRATDPHETTIHIQPTACAISIHPQEDPPRIKLYDVFNQVIFDGPADSDLIDKLHQAMTRLQPMSVGLGNSIPWEDFPRVD